jgi:phosphatidylserine/phosphatidylglycerophosphate/cardiolipin synthase-like enzyme
MMSAILVLGLFSQAHRRPSQLVVSGPGHEGDYARAVERLIAGARSRIWVMMYVMQVGGDGEASALAEALARAHERGVSVHVCLDQGRVRGTNDVELKHVAAAEWLRARGVTVVIDELDRTSHAKILLIDDEWVVLGSHNWTNMAQTRNREASMILRDPGVSRQLEQLFATIPGW